MMLFNKMILYVTDAKYLGGYKVEVFFNDGRKGVADLSNALQGSVFQPLKDESIFPQFRLDKELNAISWPNSADVTPEYLYFQAFKDDSELQEQFKRWGYMV